MTAILTIGPTELEYGYFYELENSIHIDVKDGSIVGPSPGKANQRYSYCTVEGMQYCVVDRLQCSISPAHGQQKEVFDYEIDLTNYRLPLLPFVSECDHVIVNEWLADRLKNSGLTGFRLLPASISARPDSEDDKTAPPPNLFQLAFEGNCPGHMPHVEPPSEDRCPHCGAGPVVCPECGCWWEPCHSCGQAWGVEAQFHGGPDDPHIRFEVVGVDPFIVDPRQWDGTDFMGKNHGGWITRRALDWLLSIRAGPFVAIPIAVNVYGLTKAERETLELARRPIAGVTPLPLEKFMKAPRKKRRS